MHADKTDAVVIRLADFSESSRVVTLFTREYGKVSALAKGAKRLKGPFESALDLLSRVRVVFIRKSSDSLDLLTEAQLTARFQPRPRELTALYGGYYVAELLDGLTEPHDPHPPLFDAAVETLELLGSPLDVRLSILWFEAQLLREIGHFPDFETCLICGLPADLAPGVRHWVSQGGLVCKDCGRPDLSHTEIHSGSLAILRRLADPQSAGLAELTPSPPQYKGLRKLLTSAICHVLERRPKMLAYLKF